jgi:CDP-glucose 4,6-dehydratase
LRAIVVITTDKCYENHEKNGGYREDEPLGGYDPYSSSKACAELVTDSYRRSFFHVGSNRNTARIASARAGNVIGGGDWAVDRLIPDAIRAFEEGRSVAVRYPDSVRPWQHVLDVLHGYLVLTEALCGRDGSSFAEPWNFGPDEHDVKPVRWVVDRFCAIWGENPGWHVDGQPQPHEAAFLKLDCTKAHTRLGWRPALPLDDALRLTADWYRGQFRGGDVGAITRRQLKYYMQLMDGSRA